MFFDVISSGSKGNCTIVSSFGKVILLDYGISKKRVCEALEAYGLSYDDISAFFLTHTHSDHASNAYQAPIEKLYCPLPKIAKIDTLLDEEHLVKPFQTYTFGSLKVTSFPLSHDCKNTMGYVVSDSIETLVYLTDTGFVPEKDFPTISNATYYIFESNHDAKMLFESKRPDYLIRRIISDTGHLSNYDASYYLSSLIGDKTKEVVLSHLSDECNTQEKALSTFEEVMQAQLGYLPDIEVVCASDKRETKGGK